MEKSDIINDTNKKRNPLFKWAVNLFKLVLTIIIFIFLTIAGINLYMIGFSSGKILPVEEATKLNDVDRIVVLGASVYGTSPSAMLKDRLDIAVTLHQSGVSDRLLMSGDNSSEYYNEVGAMALYAEAAGISDDQIDQDPAGLCTYDSFRNAKTDESIHKIVIVTQKYHMYRAIYLAEKMGLEAYGVCAVEHQYTAQDMREIREIAARCKDFFMIVVGEERTEAIFKRVFFIDIFELIDRY